MEYGSSNWETFIDEVTANDVMMERRIISLWNF